MAHLTPEQLVDIAEGVAADKDAPHLASCARCTQQLMDLRAMLTEIGAADVPEPSPLALNQLSARVRVAVTEDAVRRRSWRERLLQPWVLVPSFAGALAVALLAVLLPRQTPAPAAPVPSTSIVQTAAMPVAGARLSLPAPEPSLPPLGVASDPQLGLVADVGTTLDWDEMRDEIALDVPGTSSDAVVGALTADEQRELQRLLADEMAQPGVPENRS